VAFDLLIRGGTVLDPTSDVEGILDVAVTGDRVEAVGRDLPGPAGREIDATGLYVTPGLIDLHTHIYPWATYWGVEPDPIAARTGVTTWVDAGTTGGYGFPGFKKWVVETSQSRVFSFLNLSEIGLTGRTYELSNIEYSDAALVAGTIQRHREVIIGIKVRADVLTTRGTGIKPLKIARRIADELDVPIMVHVGKGPPALRDIVDLLSPGDIITHCFTGHDNRVIADSGDPLPFVKEAWDRGLILDIGHGTGSFSFATATEMVRRGFAPDVISTDTHHMSIQGPMFDLPTTLSKFLALGMSLRDVIERATAAPARAIGHPELGTLKVGAVADIAILEVADGDYTFYDVNMTPLKGNRLIRARKTIRCGVTMAERPLPQIPFWVEIPAQQQPIIGRLPGESI
jgi:dihydroorotase